MRKGTFISWQREESTAPGHRTRDFCCFVRFLSFSLLRATHPCFAALFMVLGAAACGAVRPGSPGGHLLDPYGHFAARCNTFSCADRPHQAGYKSILRVLRCLVHLKAPQALLSLPKVRSWVRSPLQLPQYLCHRSDLQDLCDAHRVCVAP